MFCNYDLIKCINFDSSFADEKILFHSFAYQKGLKFQAFHFFEKH